LQENTANYSPTEECDLYQLAKEALEAAVHAVRRGEEMLLDELRKVAALTTSVEWSTWPEKEQLQALNAQIDRVNHAKANAKLAHKSYNLLKKSARKVGL
jgi:hypothetical protein